MKESESTDKKIEEQGKKEQRSAEEGPKFMAPQQPVLEEPLEENESNREMGEKMDSPSIKDDPQLTEQGVIEQAQTDNHENEFHAGKIHPDSDKLKGTPPGAPNQTEVPYSPYFPRGIYENARTVEEYYGRLEPTIPYHPFDKDLDDTSRVEPKPLYRAILLLFTILIILGLIFLALLGGIAFPFL